MTLADCHLKQKVHIAHGPNGRPVDGVISRIESRTPSPVRVKLPKKAHEYCFEPHELDAMDICNE